MYQVTLINNDEKTIINHVSVLIDSNKIQGTFKQGINTIDSFTFTVTPLNDGFEKIHGLTTKIEILNTISNEVEFRGRVLLPVPSMDNSGVYEKKVICESELGYFMDTTTRYAEFHDMSVETFLGVLIDNHNKQTSPDKHFKLGKVEVTANLYRFLDYEKTLDSIKENLLNKLGGELQIRHENGDRYLDYLIERGEIQETEIRLARNLISIEKEVDPTKVAPRLVAYGAKKEDTEERISFKEINNGNDYIDDLDAIKEFGIVESVFTWDDVTIPSNLLRKAIEKQKEVNRALVKHKISALDLSIIGLDIDGFNVCDSYKIINPIMNIDSVLRVVEKTVDINSPQNSSLMIGDKFYDIKEYNKKMNATTKNLEKLKGTVNTTIDIVSNVNSDLNNTVEIVNNTVDILNTTNQNVGVMASNLIDVNESLQKNIIATNQIANQVVLITETLAATTNKLDKLKRRTMLGV